MDGVLGLGMKFLRRTNTRLALSRLVDMCVVLREEYGGGRSSDESLCFKMLELEAAIVMVAVS